jgi:amidase
VSDTTNPGIRPFSPLDGVSPEEPATALAAAVREGRMSAADVMERHLARVAASNGRLNALTVVFADRARRAADDLDRRIAAGEDPGPFAGVPMSVKENIDLTWSATTSGWRPLADAVPARDATVVRRMRAAGAIPVGRGNMPDFGMRWDTDNDLFGRTHNPWDDRRTAYGSSGGDAVAVATGMSSLGLGNDFGGSVRLPASAVGVVGLRPSRGRVPRSAVGEKTVALSLQEFSVNGPIARSVADVAAALDVLEGADVDDPVSRHVAGIRSDAVPRRVGVVRDPAGGDTDAEIRAGVERAAAALARAGWEVVDLELPHLAEAALLWRRLACTDMLLTLNPAILPEPLGRSATVFLRDSTAGARPFQTAAEYAAAWARRAVIHAAWRRMQDEVPVILGPVATQRTPLADYDLGGQEAATAAWRALRLVVAVNLLGLPAVSVPIAQGSDGLPISVQLIAASDADAVALAAAQDVEDAARLPLTATPLP